MKEKTSKDKILTTKELADYIKLNEKTIIRMAQKGILPGKKVGNQWRFYLSTIDEYLQDNIVQESNYDLSRLISSFDEIIPLSRLTGPACVKLELEAETRDDILYELAGIAQEAGLSLVVERLFEKLRSREDMLSTAVGNGIAIPHPRNPSDDLFTRPGLIIARSRKGVEFSSPDAKKVHLFFVTCAPDVVLHLKLLSKVAHLLQIKDVFPRFMAAGSKDEIIRILLEQERIKV